MFSVSMFSANSLVFEYVPTLSTVEIEASIIKHQILMFYVSWILLPCFQNSSFGFNGVPHFVHSPPELSIYGSRTSPLVWMKSHILYIHFSSSSRSFSNCSAFNGKVSEL